MAQVPGLALVLATPGHPVSTGGVGRPQGVGSILIDHALRTEGTPGGAHPQVPVRVKGHTESTPRDKWRHIDHGCRSIGRPQSTSRVLVHLVVLVSNP